MTPTLDRTERIVAIGAIAGYLVASFGALALITIGLFFWAGQPWGTLNDLALVVMTGALAPLMLTFYELGGLTPLRPAQAAQSLGWLAILTWCAVQLLMVLGVVTFDFEHAATGAFAVESWATVYIGLWIAGASLLAGPWLIWIRWVGVLVGVGVVIFSAGLLSGGIGSSLTYVGGIAYQLGLPAWALLMARHLGRLQRQLAGNPSR